MRAGIGNETTGNAIDVTSTAARYDALIRVSVGIEDRGIGHQMPDIADEHQAAAHFGPPIFGQSRPECWRRH